MAVIPELRAPRAIEAQALSRARQLKEKKVSVGEESPNGESPRHYISPTRSIVDMNENPKALKASQRERK